MKQIYAIISLLIFSSQFVFSQVEIQMEEGNGVFFVPGKVNGLELKFIFDTGASNVSISLSEAAFMLKNGYLDADDIIGSSYSQIANGDLIENTDIILREIEIGGIKIKDIRASVSHTLSAPLLLGQSAIQKLGPIQIDGNKLIIANGKDFKSEKDGHELYMKAFQAIEAGQYETAIRLSLEGIKKNSNNMILAMHYDNLATAYYYMDKKQDAIDACYKGLAEDFTNSQLQYNLGVFLYETDQYFQAENAFNKLIQLNSLSKNVPNKYLYSSYCYIGLIQSKNGQYAPAEQSFKSAIETAINKSDIGLQSAYNGLGDIYYEQEKYSNAIAAYERGISLQPNRPSNITRYYKLAYCYIFTDSLNEALKNFESVMRIYTNLISYGESGISYAANMAGVSIDACIWLGRLYAKLGKPDESVKYYNNIITVFDGGRELFEINDYLTLYLLYLQNSIDTATIKNIVSNGAEKFPDNPEITFMQATLTDVFEEQIQFYKKIINVKDNYKPLIFDYATVYNNIAWAYYNIDQPKIALPYAKKSISMNSNYDYSWGTLGRIYYKIGNYSECIEAMERCIKIPKSSYVKDAYEFIGNAYIKLGKISKGEKYLEKAKQIL